MITVVDSNSMTAAALPLKPAKRPRDVRLDVFRGLCLVIIYVAHIWDNPWASFIPARFGFSDATEIFVFCSGMASAVAFGGTFAKRGFWIGTHPAPLLAGLLGAYRVISGGDRLSGRG
jgi:hypothetical protein